jgi:hypothetical protein
MAAQWCVNRGDRDGGAGQPEHTSAGRAGPGGLRDWRHGSDAPRRGDSLRRLGPAIRVGPAIRIWEAGPGISGTPSPPGSAGGPAGGHGPPPRPSLPGPPVLSAGVDSASGEWRVASGEWRVGARDTRAACMGRSVGSAGRTAVTVSSRSRHGDCRHGVVTVSSRRGAGPTSQADSALGPGPTRHRGRAVRTARRVAWPDRGRGRAVWRGAGPPWRAPPI